MPTNEEHKASEVVIQSLLNAGVHTILGIPGAKIDAVFNGLMDHPEIKLIVCRHEQNMAFIAQAMGRITGRPGVCIATSGPGTSNLVTALLTANTEGDPVVALCGAVPQAMSLKRTHQSFKAVETLTPVTKKTVGVEHPDQVAEVMVDVFRVASSHPKGATAVCLPQNIMNTGVSKFSAFQESAFTPALYGGAAKRYVDQAIELLQQAHRPVLFLGARASHGPAVAAIHKFLKTYPLPVVETFQAAGALSEEMLNLFCGRVGLFRNQPGDKVLANADLILSVGYDPTEYEPPNWNPTRRHNIVHMDYESCDYEAHYEPKVELLGSIVENMGRLTEWAEESGAGGSRTPFSHFTEELVAWKKSPKAQEQPGEPVHPIHFIRLLRERLSHDTVVTCDIGSVYIWMSRFFQSYQARTFLVSDGQQTLGVGLPWAIGASLVQDPPCSKKVVSVSGDGGFMFSSQELSTAVQQKCNITQFIFNDDSYNMVEFQEVAKYGRSSGVELGGVDFVKFAEAFGAKGFRVLKSEDMQSVMEEALAYDGVSIVDIRIDYRDNDALMTNVIQDHQN
ncbi:hypothetical protein M8818_000447 [Zalaria obscura]|uniref:Uncharacterized protein n=1 Tax=Zalaria obscura TaxID=2024903 RepID=A0ACC3SND8_9PEZI